MRTLLAIARIETRECLRSKSIYVIFVLMLSFILLNRGCTMGNSPVTSTILSQHAQQNLPVSIAFHIISFWSMVLCGLIASSVLPKELEEKKLIMVLSRPVKRSVFLAGKMFAVFFLSSLSFFLFISIFFVFRYLDGGYINPKIIPASFIFQLNIILMTLGGFFSSLLLPRMLAPLAGLFVYMMSFAIEIPFYFNRLRLIWEPSALLQTVHRLFPRVGEVQFLCGSLMNSLPAMKEFIVPVSNVLLYSLILWLLVVFIFNRKQF